MKKTIFTTKISKFLGSEKGLLTMSAIVVLYAFIYQFRQELFYVDTKSYFDAYNIIKNGNIDDLRTPVYPIFIGIIHDIIGASYCNKAIMLIQMIIFIVSVHYFHKIALLLKDYKISYWLTFAYGVIPIVNLWSTVILTESLAISGSVFYLYYTIYTLKEDNNKAAWLSTFWMLILILLKPALTYILLVSFFVFIISYKNKVPYKNTILKGIIGCIIVSFVFCGYCIEMKRLYGTFTPSGVSIINKYMIKKELGIIDIKSIEKRDKEIAYDIKNIEKSMSGDDDFSKALFILNKYGCKRMNEIIKSEDESFISSLKGLDKRIFLSSKNSYNVVGIPPIISINFINPNMGTFFLLLIITFFIIILYTYKTKRTPNIITLFFLFASGNITVSIIGAPEDYGRLFLPSYPAVLLLTGILIQMIKDRSFLKNKFEE